MNRADHRRLARSAVAIGALIGGMLAPTGDAQAYTFKILHSFCARSDCGDGEHPGGPLTFDGSGNIFGTAGSGAEGGGLIFELSPDADKKTWQYRVIHRFCMRRSDCVHDEAPDFLIADIYGNLYGTASQGGAYGGGAAFELAASGSKWVYTDLVDFCPKIGSNCSRGRNPYGLTYVGADSGALWDGTSPLFGSASSHLGDGVAFTLLRDGSLWREGATYPLSTAIGLNPLLAARGGDFYATLNAGSPGRHGLIAYFRFHRPRTETLLYTFCPAGDPCTDGAYPGGRLAMDGSGTLYGVTQGGGKHGDGVVFTLDPASKQYTVIYNFCSLTNCEDGWNAFSGAILDGSGDLLGAASRGGPNDSGVIFKMVNVGGWSELVLHSFCSEANCADGRFPDGPLLSDGHGDFFGMTYDGGAHGDFGTVYELMP